MENIIKFSIEKIAEIISNVFKLFFSLLYSNGYLNIFGYMFLIIAAIIIFTSVMNLIIPGDDDDEN